MWKIAVEQNGKWVDTGIRLEKDPDFWINEQHKLDGKSYSAEKAPTGIIGSIKTGWAKMRSWI